MLIAGPNLVKSGEDELIQWVNESEDASMRHDPVQIVSCTCNEILEQSCLKGHWLVHLKKRKQASGFDKVLRNLGINKRGTTA